MSEKTKDVKDKKLLEEKMKVQNIKQDSKTGRYILKD